jgi:hypothetical protein
MEVIFDMNAPSQNTPDAGVVAHRKAELETMLSPELAEMVRSGKIRLVTYQQLVTRTGVARMRRPPTEEPGADPVTVVKRELAARYAENEAGFFARDADRVMRLRHPAFHTITPDGNVSTREQMYQRTRAFIGRVEKFDSLSETITTLTLSGDTAHAIIDQRTVRQQRFPDSALHQVRTSVIQRESWIKTPAGWLLWRVDQIQPGQTLVDGRPPQT